MCGLGAMDQLWVSMLLMTTLAETDRKAGVATKENRMQKTEEIGGRTEMSIEELLIRLLYDQGERFDEARK